MAPARAPAGGLAAALLALAPAALGQQAGTQQPEVHPQIWTEECTPRGCAFERSGLVIDANWRWVNKEGRNCYTDRNTWDRTLCSDPVECAMTCGVDGADYLGTYGVSTNRYRDGVILRFVTEGRYSKNFGSRLYVMDGEDTYRMYYLKNRELSLTVDVSELPCGLNGAVYFVEMDQRGDWDGRGNTAGARFGTGYCDAQCPHDIKFIKGEANLLNWNSTSTPPVGHYGTCCAEMDIWEANSMATAFTPHTCTRPGLVKCEGVVCGDTKKGQRYDGICDKDGCDFNTYRMGSKDFYGISVKTDEVITVVTQFVTTDGTDDGELKEIRRTYIQGGRQIQNSPSAIPGIEGDSLTDAYCGANKYQFKGTRAKDNEAGDFDQFGKFGGMAKVGEALERGMVVAISLWDDPGSNMRWLDSVSPHREPGVKGARRGPCDPEGNVKHTRRMHQMAYVKFTNFMYGGIGSTIKAKTGARLRRRFEQKRVRTRKTAAEQRRPMVFAGLAAAASLGLLALLPAAWARARCHRATTVGCTESAGCAGDLDEAVEPLAPAAVDES